MGHYMYLKTWLYYAKALKSILKFYLIFDNNKILILRT